MKSQHEFSQVPRADIPRSSFNLSHGHKTTFDADYLIPICQPIDIIPGDTFSWKTNFYIRLNTMIRPILDNLRFETFAFFVPYRLIWTNWERMHGAQDNPGDSIDYTVPVVTGTSTVTGEGYLWDYFGLPLDNKAGAHIDPDDVTVSALPWRAYALIWDDWFRDQNLQDGIFDTNTRGDGPDTISVTPGGAAGRVPAAPLKRGKRHDYFTSALPWPQKQTLGVSLPLGTSAPVKMSTETDDLTWNANDGGINANLFVENDGNVRWASSGTGFGSHELEWDNSNGMIADLSNATAATINDIRLAFQTQRLLERDARSGTRYVEALKAHWGVTSPDFRLQRPEFLGGGSSVVQLTPVQQTNAQTTPAENDKLGNLAANGMVAGTHSWSKSFVEHGVVIILGNVRGDISYSQGIDRYWGKQTRYDFYYPVLAGIGEQSILMRELWTQGDGATTDDTVFGYQGRYDEYRRLNSKLTGLMNVDAASSLSSWHLSEDFTSQPSLGSSFIEANTGVPLDRAVAVSTEPHFLADFYHQVKAARPLPVYGVPGNLDHF